MAYSDLTTDQKKHLQDWLQLVRPIQGEVARAVARALNHMGAAQTAHDSHVGDVLALLASGDVIPNESGLAGAIDVDKSELTAILSLLSGMLTTYDTPANRELWTKFCGADNLIG